MLCEIGEESQRYEELTIEKKKSIIHCIIAELWANVSYMNAFEGFMSFHISDLADERVWTIRLSSEEKLRHDNSMIRGTSERTDPPLRGCKMGRM